MTAVRLGSAIVADSGIVRPADAAPLLVVDLIDRWASSERAIELLAALAGARIEERLVTEWPGEPTRARVVFPFAATVLASPTRSQDKMAGAMLNGLARASTRGTLFVQRPQLGYMR